MSLKPVISFLFVIAVLWSMNKFFNIDHHYPNVEFIPEMVHSVAYDAYAPNGNFSDGKTLQNPAVGTIARGFMPEYSEGNLTEESAGEILINTIKINPENLERGKFIYETYCGVCHGSQGLGDGPVTKRGVPPPPSILTPKVLNMSDGQIYYIISNGRGNMASYKSQVQRQDRWKVIHYLRSLGE